MKIDVYTDGSGQTSDGPGGWAFVVVIDGVEQHRANGSIPSATNNVAEITAAIKGLEYVAGIPSGNNVREVCLVSDSQLVLGYASGRYKCKAMHLLPLFIQLKKLYRQLNASERWVRGHSGDQYNEICDGLAKTARESLLNSGV
jgi:ribonuclease HI